MKKGSKHKAEICVFALYRNKRGKVKKSENNFEKTLAIVKSLWYHY